MSLLARPFRSRPLRVAACAALVCAPAAANHGPGTSGGGSATMSGEVLKQGQFDFSLRTDWTEFQHFSRAEAESHAASSGGFDAIDRSISETFSIAYGVTDDLQVGASVGYYWGSNFVDAEDDAGTVDSGVADPQGLTDLWLTTKLRVLHGQQGRVAVLLGLKLPTGKDDEKLDNGEVLEPSSQPGSGSVDGQVGVGYSRFLSSQLTFDASAIYTVRTEHDDFEVGDRLDLGAAIAYRLTPDIQEFPNWSVSGEVLAVHLGKDDDAGEKNDNSGGTTWYVSPGVRSRINPNLAVGLAAAFPVVQDLNGDQVETRAKAALTLTFAF